MQQVPQQQQPQPQQNSSILSNGGCPASILEYLKTRLGPDALDETEVQEAKSAQQKVWVLSKLRPSVKNMPSEWKQALQVGKNRLVVRQWKASSCWWNLNRNHQQPVSTGKPKNTAKNRGPRTEAGGIELLAQSEIAGYRIARKALPKIHIPFVLHFSHDKNHLSASQNNEKPWAILAYVGHFSTLFDTNNNNDDFDDWKPDLSWMNGMVKNRVEFGFDEPHPRWGRVPHDQCVEYTLSVLRSVIIPLHSYIRDHSDNIRPELHGLRTANDGVGITFAYMVSLYQQAQQRMKKETNMSHNHDPKLQSAIQLLEKAIAKLKEQQTYSSIPLQPFVLCHMDCQPQNLIFAQPATTATATPPRISSVFDWEEAALADPRFELLLLCRKVCANRSQAEQIWRVYEQECHQPELGPIHPWLALETVHSITSLLLQSMDLLGGGRSPWESKPDLWGKIYREIRRLSVEYSWTFYDIPEFQ